MFVLSIYFILIVIFFMIAMNINRSLMKIKKSLCFYYY